VRVQDPSLVHDPSLTQQNKHSLTFSMWINNASALILLVCQVNMCKDNIAEACVIIPPCTLYSQVAPHTIRAEFPPGEMHY